MGLIFNCYKATGLLTVNE